jgi:ribose transport system substrate-binding protein
MPNPSPAQLSQRPRLLLRSLSALLPLALLAVGCSTAPPSSTTAPPSTPGGAPSASSDTTLFQKPRKAEGDVFVQIVTNGISPFWDPMAIGMKKTAGELGCKAEWSGPRDATVAEQKQMVEGAVAKGADGIALSCIEAKASEPIINALIEQKIPVITFDSDSPGSKRLAYIGTNNFNAGKAAGEAAVKLLPNGGKFVAFVGNISAQNARERHDGFVEATKGHNIELVGAPIDDGKDATRARRNVEDAMAKHGDQVQGFLGLFSYNGPAIVQAVTAAGKRDKYKIVAFDAEPKTLEELAKGNIDATVVQKPYDFGVLSTKLLYLINRKGWPAAKAEMKIPDDGLYDTGVQVVTPENVKQYRLDLEKLGVKSS